MVDYRRVNQRTERAVYFVRNQEEIVTSCAGSVYLTLVDACKGFNQIVNTERARQMLAILARSGQYLPRCLTFGPTNGPEDFAFATDRVFAPGEGRRRFFCDNWQIYADDITIRTGRVLSGVLYTDEEYRSKIDAAKKRKEEQENSEYSDHAQMVSLEEALRALGFAKKGKEKPGAAEPADKKKKASSQVESRETTEGERSATGLCDHAASFQSPIAHAARASEEDGAPPPPAVPDLEWSGLEDSEPMSRLQPWEIESLLVSEAAAMVARFPDVGDWEIIRRILQDSGPAGRLARRFPDRGGVVSRILVTAMGDRPNDDDYLFQSVFLPWSCRRCWEAIAQSWWICPLCNRERVAQRTQDVIPRGWDVLNWSCSACGTFWPAELCRCLHCGTSRTLPTRLYAGI